LLLTSESNLLPTEKLGAVEFAFGKYVPGPKPSPPGLLVENLSPGNMVLFFNLGPNYYTQSKIPFTYRARNMNVFLSRSREFRDALFRPV
jgi:hypothetical protein